MELRRISDLKAITFDDFFTLRYPLKEQEDIVFPIMRALKKEGISFDEKEFLKWYFKEDKLYRKRLKETLRESLLDDLIESALKTCSCESRSLAEAVRKAVDFGLKTRGSRWFPNVRKTLTRLRSRGYRLGLISNTHWRISDDLRKELKRFFDVVTLSYEHGYAKPHQSIFTVTLERLGASANQCLHVGDDPTADIQGAKNAGMKTAFIKRTNMTTDADVEIRRISELEALL